VRKEALMICNIKSVEPSKMKSLKIKGKTLNLEREMEKDGHDKA
jgi:hypothetical protein